LTLFGHELVSSSPETKIDRWFFREHLRLWTREPSGEPKPRLEQQRVLDDFGNEAIGRWVKHLRRLWDGSVATADWSDHLGRSYVRIKEPDPGRGHYVVIGEVATLYVKHFEQQDGFVRRREDWDPSRALACEQVPYSIRFSYRMSRDGLSQTLAQAAKLLATLGCNE
jgi:hypothetical protein